MTISKDILVDMDGVLATFDASLEATLASAHPNIAIVRPRKNFYIHEDYPEEHHLAVQGIWQARGFYRGLGIMDGAVTGWGTMMEQGCAPRICSSPIRQNPDCVEEKKGWLEEFMVPHFGYSIIDRAIFDRDKSKYGAFALALIDDKPAIAGLAGTGCEHVVFDAPYNKNSATALRLYGWRDPGLISLLAGLIKSRAEE